MMQRNIQTIVCGIGISLFFCSIIVGQDKKAAPANANASKTATAQNSSEFGPPAPLKGIDDKGVFFIHVNEEPVFKIEFELKANGFYKHDAVLSLGEQKAKFRTEITPDSEGRWSRIVVEQAANKTTLQRTGSDFKATTSKRETTGKCIRDGILFDNYGPALISQHVRMYDLGKKGKQSFRMSNAPPATPSFVMEYKDHVERAVGGKDYKFIRYSYLLPPSVDTTLWADSAGKIYMIEVPAQKAAYIREGFESLRKVEESDPLISKPASQIVVKKNVPCMTRDRVSLATDVFTPAEGGRRPTILIRTPYKKEVMELTGKYYARRGYTVAIQDCRGRFSSKGIWEPFLHEAKDGYDAVEWAAAQPWSDGKIGMIGASYVGWVQWWAASERPPHLVTIIPNVAPPEPFFNIPYEYGVFFLWGSIWWADVLETGATADITGQKMSEIGAKKYGKLLKQLPVIELDKSVLGRENPYWRKWIENPVNGGYWEPANFHNRLQNVRIPVFHQSGWFDGDGIGSKLNYAKLASLSHPKQKLVLGPWGHSDVATRGIGENDFGPNALRDLPREYLRWFDHYLKGIDNKIDQEPLVSLFVMSSNVWVNGPCYPLPETKFENWYLTSAGSANSTKGNGKLVREIPADGTDKYTYDPADPTPTPMLPLDDEEEEDPAKSKLDAKAKQKLEEEKKAKREARLNDRKDILVFVTEPFAEDYTFAGPVSARLWASSSAKDTDWIVRMQAVGDKDKKMILCEGRLRARYRNSTYKPEMLEPGKPYEFQIDMWQTGMTIAKGKRLRVEVASAAFPMFSRNLNTGGHNEKETNFVKADQIIYHGKKHPSCLILPSLPKSMIVKATEQSKPATKK